MKRAIQILVLIVLGTCSGCKPLVKVVNKYFPPLTTRDQQLTSIRQNLLSANTITPQVGVYISRETLDTYLPGEVKKAAEAFSDSTVSIISFEPELSLGSQSIITKAKFAIKLNEYNAVLKGDLLGVTSVSTSNDSLYLRSAFQTLDISAIDFTEKPNLKNRALSKLIKPVVSNFLNNLNGVLLNKPSSIHLGWKEPLQMDPKELFKSPSTEVLSEVAVIDRKLKSSSILIDDSGIWLLIEIEKPGAAQEEVAVMSASSEANVRSAFKSFKEKFEEKWLSSFDKIEPSQKMVVNIKKSEIASILNESLAQVITIRSKINSDKQPFSAKVEVENSKVDCQKVRKPFHYDRYERERCNWSCRVNTPLGSFDDPVCLASRAACNTKEEARVAADNIRYEAEKAAHNVLQESEVAACNVWREATNFAALGKFSGYTEGNGGATIEFNKFIFSDDLTAIDLMYSGNIEYKLKSEINIQPMDLGYIFLCQVEYSKTTNSVINVGVPTQQSRLSVLAESEGENLLIKTHLSPIKYSATISSSPLHEMYKDPAFLGGCSFFSGIIGPSIAAGSLSGVIKLKPEEELILFGKAKGEYKMEEMNLRIDPIPFKINGSENKSVVKWTSKNIQFTAG
ncbi:hypothetical protein AB9P05_10950 [Roseivirga sp. BDSF3-8]|uniref:hypothetical protein n=1 Tax=Roseivirga sp. BDSF3-8 TaxID=3241598 RepID=UPI00353201FD